MKPCGLPRQIKAETASANVRRFIRDYPTESAKQLVELRRLEAESVIPDMKFGPPRYREHVAGDLAAVR